MSILGIIPNYYISQQTGGLISSLYLLNAQAI